MWNGEPPSGREHAIETLLDTEPHSSRIRTARVLVRLLVVDVGGGTDFSSGGYGKQAASSSVL
jgi:hypothetical protein